MNEQLKMKREEEKITQTISQKIKCETSLQQINFYMNRRYVDNQVTHPQSLLHLSPNEFIKQNRKLNRQSYWPIDQHIAEFKNEKKQRESNSFVTKMIYLKSGKEIVVGYNRPDRGDINFIEPTTPRVIQFYYKQLTLGLGGIAAYEDGRRILIADRKGRFTWVDVVTKDLNDIKAKIVTTAAEGIVDISLSPSQTLVACGSKESSIFIFDCVVEKTQNKEFKYQKSLAHESTSISSVMWHPYKSLLVSGSVDQTVNLWDAHNKFLVYSNKHHKDSVSKVMFHHDGNTYYSMSKDKNIHQYDLRMRGVLQKYSFEQEPKDMQFTQDMLVVGDNAGTMFFFDQFGGIVSKTPGKSGVLAFTIDADNWMVVARKDGNMFDLYGRKIVV